MVKIIDESLSLEIVQPNEASAQLIMSWRNDPSTLAASFDSRPKTWPQFYDEVRASYCSDPFLPSLFILHDSRRVGLIRFRRLPVLFEGRRACDISINIDPAYRGKGVAIPALKMSVQTARNAGIQLIVADIKPQNGASIKSFEGAGFRLSGDVEAPLPDGQGHVTVRRYILNLHTEAVLAPSGRRIGPGNPCFIIAEAGSNWRMGTKARDLKMAKALIDVALECGADAVKFQTYKPATTYVENAGQSDYLSDNGIQESITDIFADLSMPYEMIPELAEYAEKQGILFMSSPFSAEDFRAIDPFTQIHKIASYEISHRRLIETIAAAGKPTILSTGASDLADIDWAVRHFQKHSSAALCLMQCTARYPAPLSALNLGTIPLLKARFGVPVGLSDHTREPISGPLAAVALGADLIEKHYTLDNRLPGPDHAFALTATELKQMVKAVRDAEQVVGTGSKTIQGEEEELFWYARRGLQAIKKIQKGDSFSEGINFDILRPGKQRRGAHPKHIEKLLSGRSTREINIGDGIQLDDIAEPITS